MASLESYLRGKYQQDKQQIRDIDEIVDEVIPTFVRDFGEVDKEADDVVGRIETWPYDVSKEPSKITKFSFSTHAMISFALDAITTRPIDSALISERIESRRLGLGKKDRKKLFSTLGAAKRVLVDLLSKERDPFVHSGTYGRNDPLTLTWLAELAHRCKAGQDDIDVDALEKCKRKIIDAAKQVFLRESGSLLDLKKDTHYEIEHSFLKLRCLHLAKAAAFLEHSRLAPFRTKIERESLESDVYRQLGYFDVPDSRFDPAELVFALEAVLQFGRFGLNQSTIERVFTILNKSQDETPYWRPVAPFLGTKQGMVLFPVSVEIVNSLLRICGILDEKRSPVHFSLIEPLLRRYAQWIIARIERFEGQKGRVAGWHSEHVNEPGRIHLWETSQVLLFLAHYASMLQDKIAADGLTEAGLKLRDHRSLSRIPGYWDDEPVSNLGNNYEVLSRIREGFIKRRKRDSDHKPDNSLLLYGPPGTGKTTVAEQMIFELKWPLLTITVSDFLADGAAEVEARAKGVFQVLQEQREIVILFDEIDQFLLDRNSDDYKNQTGIFQFLTPGMLTKFQDLRDAARSVFIVATNYEERIDSAIKRKGRFDNQLLLSLPDTKRRHEFIWKFLSKKLANVTKQKDWKWTDGELKRFDRMKDLAAERDDLEEESDKLNRAVGRLENELDEPNTEMSQTEDGNRKREDLQKEIDQKKKELDVKMKQIETKEENVKTLKGEVKSIFRKECDDQKLVEKTALFGFGDLKHLVEQELKIDVKEVRDNVNDTVNYIVGDTVSSIAKKLNDRVAEVLPAVKLSAYKNRFDPHGMQQCPFEEFAVLLYLVGEVNDDESTSSMGNWNWIEGIRAELDENLERFPEEIQQVVKDLVQRLTSSGQKTTKKTKKTKKRSTKKKS